MLALRPILLALAMFSLTALFAAPAANAQTTQAKGFQNGVPYDKWPADPNHPIRRLCDSIPGATGTLHWALSSGNPPPPGTPAGAVLVTIQKSYHENCWTNPFTGAVCCSFETTFDVTITFGQIGPDDGPSQFHYQYLSGEYRCIGGMGNNSRNIVKSVLSTATLGTFNDVSLQSSVTQNSSGVITSRSINSNLVVPTGATTKVAQSLGPIAPATKVEIVAAPGGTVDLTGHDGSTPICTTATPAIIRANTILLDPGVTLNQLFVPPPQVLPAQTRVELALSLVQYPIPQAPDPGAAVYSLLTRGNTAVPVNITWSDTQGWAAPGPIMLTLQPGEPQTITIPLSYLIVMQPWDKSTLTITATPLSTSGSPVTVATEIYFDSDLDGDGIKNSVDPCPTDFSGPSSPNSDGDFIPNLCDTCALFNFTPGEPCPCSAADFNGSGAATVTDIFAFLTSWFAGSSGADFNNDGLTTVIDIFDFLTSWFAGC